MEWKTTVAARDGGSGRRSSSHVAASARPTVAGTVRATSRGPPEPPQAVDLVRPYVGEEGEPALLGGGIDRREVAACSLRYLAVHGLRRGLLEDVGEADGARQGAPGPAVRLVAISVPAEVQPRACPDLQEAKLEMGLLGDGKESAEERSRTAHLIGLNRPRNEFAKFVAVLLEDGPEDIPHIAGRAVRGRIVPSQVRSCTLERGDGPNP
jgi:hypothetical protein